MKKLRNKIDEINCVEATKRFNDFIDNYLKGTSKKELMHHVENCRHCFERIEFEKMLKDKVAAFASTNANENSAQNKAREILNKLLMP